MAGSPPKPVVLAPSDPDWPRAFAALAEVYAAALGDLVQAIEHVGSTAVPSLLAKPIIDVDIVLASREDLPEAIARLAGLGYRHSGDQGVPGREAFARDGDAEVPRDGSGRRWPSHNLYVCAVDARELQRHLLFRDWLRAFPEQAAAYAVLKRQLADLHRDDRDAYCEAKTEFIEAALARAAIR